MAPPVKASLWFTICNILNKGFALLSTPILTRIMSTEQYGTFSIYQSWYSIVTIFATVNVFQGAYTTGIVRFEKEQHTLESSLLGLTTTLTLTLFGIFLFTSNFWTEVSGLPTLLVIPMFAEITFMAAYELWAATQRFDYKYKQLVAVSIFMTVGSLGLGIVAILATDYKVEARVFSDVLLKCIIGIVLYINIIWKGRSYFCFKYWKYALVFSVPLIPHFLSHFVLGQSDRIMIGTLSGKSEAAIYSVAYSISMMMTLITNAINNSFCPYTYKKLKNKEVKGIGKSANTLFCLVGGLCIITMSFAPEVINIFAGPEYYNAIWVVPPIAASVFFIFAYAMFSNVEYYYGKTIGISVASIGCAFLNLGLNYVFIRLWGYLAAGYTTLISYICLSVLHYIMYYRVAKEELRSDMKIYNTKVIFLIAAVVLIVMGSMLFVYQYSLIRYGIILSLLSIAYYNRQRIKELMQKESY